MTHDSVWKSSVDPWSMKKCQYYFIVFKDSAIFFSSFENSYNVIIIIET